MIFRYHMPYLVAAWPEARSELARSFPVFRYMRPSSIYGGLYRNSWASEDRQRKVSRIFGLWHDYGYCYIYTPFFYIYTPLYIKEILVGPNRPTEVSSPIGAFFTKKRCCLSVPFTSDKVFPECIRSCEKHFIMASFRLKRQYFLMPSSPKITDI